MHILERLISTIAPHRCISCGAEGTPLCLPCSAALPAAPECCYKCGKDAQHGLCEDCHAQSSLQTITVRTVYAGTAEQAVHALKFERNKAMADALGRSLAGLCPAGIITHVPTANRRVRQRGYDQAQLIARALATASGNTYKPLLRRRGRERQLGQNRAVRQSQLQNAFYPSGVVLPANTSIILVDDVLTTGSTFEAAAANLKSAGFVSVHAVTFAWAT